MDKPTLDPRREPIPTIEEFAKACGVEFQEKWRRDLDLELASIEIVQDADEVLRRLRCAGFRLALASNLAPAYIGPAVRLLGDLVDVTCFSCEPDVRAVKPTAEFFSLLITRLGLPACVFHGRWASIPRHRGQPFHASGSLADWFMGSGSTRWVKRFRRARALAHAFADKGQPVSVMDEPVEDGISNPPYASTTM